MYVNNDIIKCTMCHFFIYVITECVSYHGSDQSTLMYHVFIVATVV